MNPLLIVGAGLAGAVLARQLAEAGLPVQVIDAEPRIGGNCCTERDPQTGIMLHLRGPHVFHTSHEEVWRFINRFGEWVPYVSRIKASTERGVYGLPINLHTINQFFGTALTPGEAREFLKAKTVRGKNKPSNFEEHAKASIGPELYKTFFRGYTVKQWGCDPRELPASILKRLPVRFDYNDNYFDSTYQAIPRDGYSAVIEAILTHPLISVSLETPWERAMRPFFEHVFFSGAIDRFYEYAEGRLGYRTVSWSFATLVGDAQGTAVINFPGLEVPWTRMIEHKHFTPWERFDNTVISKEFSRESLDEDLPCYPKRLEADLAVMRRYVSRATSDVGVSFIGRLGTYRYLDMDIVIAESLDFAARWLAAHAESRRLPVFSAEL